DVCGGGPQGGGDTDDQCDRPAGRRAHQGVDRRLDRLACAQLGTAGGGFDRLGDQLRDLVLEVRQQQRRQREQGQEGGGDREHHEVGQLRRLIGAAVPEEL